MSGALLERDAPVATLHAAVTAAVAGRGSVVLLSGEAGIGKTSVVRAFVDAVDASIRVLAGACDDLRVRRPLGPLRDAARGTGGPLERALAEDAMEPVFAAAVTELGRGRATVLVMEDVHWIDDATLDVLRHLTRRIDGVPAVLLLTFRADEVGSGHPLGALLGDLGAAPAHRISLPPLTRTAVAVLARGTGHDGTALHNLTAGNPFFVTEALAARFDALPGGVPATVADAVAARLGQLSPAGRAALEQLAVVPTQVGFELAEALLGRLDVLDEAEERGVIEVRAAGVAFRHELARRAIETRTPAIRRRLLNRAVVAALLAQQPREPDRVVHHAIEADDGATVAAFAPAAGREAARLGSHRQALAHFEVALRHADRLDPVDHARLLDDHAWELYNANRFDDAVTSAADAVRRYEELGDRIALGEALVRLSRHHYMTGATAEAERAVERAVRELEATAAPAGARAFALAHLGSVLALTERSVAAVDVLEVAHARATAAGRTDLVAMCLNYLGVARADLAGSAGLVHLRESLALAVESDLDESTARGYTNLAEHLYRFGEYDELDRCLRSGLEFTRERGFWSHAYNLDVHRCLLLVRRGDWVAAEDGLRPLVAATDEVGMLSVYSMPAQARLLARRGRPEARPLLERAWEQALAQRSLPGMAFAGTAIAEWAWLTGRPELAEQVTTELLTRRGRPGFAPVIGELLRYRHRGGADGGSFPGCPREWAAGLDGHWRAAAAAWAEIGDPYEEALELADSGEVEPTLTALRTLDDLGASAAAALVRARLAALGIARVPRGPAAATRANPAGLTQRQLDVLVLLGTGMTNGEIAARLVLSVRTVDHHVAAVLDKLGVRTRRDASAVARDLDASTGPSDRG